MTQLKYCQILGCKKSSDTPLMFAPNTVLFQHPPIILTALGATQKVLFFYFHVNYKNK